MRGGLKGRPAAALELEDEDEDESSLLPFLTHTLLLFAQDVCCQGLRCASTLPLRPSPTAPALSSSSTEATFARRSTRASKNCATLATQPLAGPQQRVQRDRRPWQRLRGAAASSSGDEASEGIGTAGRRRRRAPQHRFRATRTSRLTRILPALQFEGNPRTRAALVVAKYEGVDVEWVKVNPFAEGGVGADYLAKFPLGLVRLLPLDVSSLTLPCSGDTR